jgi:predicted Zn-dependent peptidase
MTKIIKEYYILIQATSVALIIFSLVLFLPFPYLSFAQTLSDRVIEHTLKNGMKVLMIERHEAPIVSMNLTYKVGGVNEHVGISGIAHLYEHMAFKGSKTIGTKDYKKEAPLLSEMDRLYAKILAERAKGPRSDVKKLEEMEEKFQKLQEEAEVFVISNELGQLYERNGAEGLNASTGKDLTRYTVSLPANRLPLWAAVESDRMAHPVLREFYKEKQVVMEERRLRYDNSPDGKLYEAFLSTAFWAHPYGLPVIGWPTDIETITRPMTEEFFKAHYGPKNAVVAIVGDIHPNEVIRLMDETFGRIPSSADPAPVEIVEPDQDGERRVEIEFDAGPRLMMGFHKPEIGTKEDDVFDVMDSILGDGRSSRLFRSLVKEKQLAVSVSTSSGTPGGKYPNMFVINAVPRAPHTTAELEEAITSELERLKTEPVEAKELQKTLNQLDAYLIRSLQSNSGLAAQVAYYDAVAGDWKYILSSHDRMAKVTPEDIRQTAGKYFVKKNRTVATLAKKKMDEKGK